MAKGTARTDRGRRGAAVKAQAKTRIKTAARRPAVAAEPSLPARIPVRVRPARDGDAAPLGRLRWQIDDAHARLLPDYFRSPGPASLAPPGGAGPVSVVLVAEALSRGISTGEGGGGLSVVGYVTVNIVDTPVDPAMTPRRRAHVDALVVDDRHRAAGIGTALMRAAETWARRHQAAELVLTVWSANEAAEVLYRRLGYQPIARVLRRILDP